MKWIFVVDENVVILAMTGENERGEPDTTCWALMNGIWKNCHALGFDGETYGVYARQLQRYSRVGTMMLVPVLLRLLRSVWIDPAKDSRTLAPDGLVDLSHLRGAPHIDDGDLVFVTLAASIQGAILVTADAELRGALTERDIPGQFGFLVLSPSEALDYAGPGEASL